MDELVELALDLVWSPPAQITRTAQLIIAEVNERRTRYNTAAVDAVIVCALNDEYHSIHNSLAFAALGRDLNTLGFYDMIVRMQHGCYTAQATDAYTRESVAATLAALPDALRGYTAVDVRDIFSAKPTEK